MESEARVADLMADHQLKPSYTFDQRHFGAKPCEPIGDCCRDMDLTILTLQEQVANLGEVSEMYSTGSTVAIHAVAIGILAGAQRIRLAGVEIPLTQGEHRYAKALRGSPISDNNATTNDVTNLVHFFGLPVWLSRTVSAILRIFKTQTGAPSLFAPDFESIMSDFQYLVDVGKRVGCQVEVFSATSNLRQLRGVTLHPESTLDAQI